MLEDDIYVFIEEKKKRKASRVKSTLPALWTLGVVCMSTVLPRSELAVGITPSWRRSVGAYPSYRAMSI